MHQLGGRVGCCNRSSCPDARLCTVVSPLIISEGNAGYSIRWFPL